MRIEEDIKLDFKDVLIRPKRSTLGSRKDVELKRYFRFKHSRDEYDGIPIMAANMDGVGTIKMAQALQEHDLFTCLIKSYNRDIENFDEFKEVLATKGGFVAAHWDGTSETEEKIKELTKATIRCIPLDQVKEDGKCVLTGAKSSGRVLFAKAY